ncbi:hypothetical protein IW261DRAFT_1589427 [Armillaria novae-zelandiae]|uniref:Protein kinase domain-containing protein n=1 Tax=Armillaria novae-zelandiae TaxID=153914 RepID=A0AA39PS10_9AGAR|nr:hypothetical protein IW261DRAFT_1589427 [Armillaria novae-zelandiae]
MDIFSTTVEVIKLINGIYTKYSDYRDADQTIHSMQHRLECVEIRLEMFREHLRHTKQGLSEDAQRVFRQSLQNVGDILYDLKDQLPPDIGFRTRLAWIGWKKRRVEDLLSQLRKWEQEVESMIFTYSLLLTVLRIKNFDSLYERLFRTGDQSLTGALALARRIHGDRNLQIHHIPVSILMPAVQPVTSNRVLAQYESRTVYLERHGPRSDALTRMAAAFRSGDLPSMHLLSCIGFTVYHGSQHFLVYQIPTLSPGIDNPTRLPILSYTFDKGIQMALEDRFRIAMEITTAVMEIHAAGWVHKSIRSDNVLISTRGGEKGVKGDAQVSSAYLVGFTITRSQNTVHSKSHPTTDPIHGLYHHPERQGGSDDHVVRFDIRHDMYSLGALLIEIGFGKTLRVLFSPATSALGLKEVLNHKRLLDHAHRLSTRMGSKYADAAITCLTKSTQPNEKTEAIRKEFYEDVLCPLQEIMDGFKKKRGIEK